MSAITGIYFISGQPADPASLQAMGDCLKHRGSDDSGIWISGCVGLGHQMLHTTPESLQEKLPLTNLLNNLAITADARIDNREELLSELKVREDPEKVTDSQLILTAYYRWGDRCPEYLLGDFAFVIWDDSQKILFCARDHFGVRPFYYHYSPDRLFAFASEIKALFCLREIPCCLNEVRIGDYLEAIFEDQTMTFFQNIFRLPAGHSLKMSPQGIQFTRYWSLDPRREVRLNSDTEYAEAFREIFTQAVQCRLRSAFPVGSALSGGLDSSSITCVAQELLHRFNRGSLLTFSAVFDRMKQCDERPFIQAVLDHGNLKSYFIYADQVHPLTDIQRVLWHQDEPFYLPNLFMHWALYQTAQQQGVRVFLDGFLGDSTVFHGGEYLIDLARMWQWCALIKEAKGISSRHAYSAGKLIWHNLWNYSLKPWIPQWLLHSLGWPDKQDQSSLRCTPLLNSEFIQRIALIERLQSFQVDKSRWFARDYHYHQLTTGEIPFALEVANKASAAFSLEARYPFADRRLAEFCLAIPPNQKLQDGFTRMIVRRALSSVLPSAVCWRSGKANVGANFLQGLRESLQNGWVELIGAPAKSLGSYVNLAQLDQMSSQFYQLGSENSAISLWLAVTFAIWLNTIDCCEPFPRVTR
jgi:asparagine synthase (glutamine-hydrolysing)